ncbi:MAG TPA: helix-hairpin-helix domain-containing protein [Terriglobales bacterium]|jgi:DNA uptake protein ComE-like DNA-binding protein|nr:helix-hairpin-helix domain-containing protein [Terriglobales bacterium]
MKRLAVLVCLLALLVWAGVPAGAQEDSTSTQTSTTTTKKTTKKSAASSSKIDINSATKDELEALPGIGPATSQKIIEGRPYRAKSELLKRKIVSANEYEKIKSEIVAHRASTKTK